MNLKGKAVLLTGGTDGIGREMARQMQAKGATVTVTGRNPERIATMQKEGFKVLAADFSSVEGVDSLLAELEGKNFDVVVNNAGYPVDHDFRIGAPNPDAADANIYTNFNTPIRLLTGMMPMLQNRKKATIVNVTSGLALAPAAGMSVYSATKAALRFFTLALREQLKGSNIHVVEALPAVVKTKNTENYNGKKMSPEECARQIVVAIEKSRDEVNIGATKMLRIVESISPALARKMMLTAF